MYPSSYGERGWLLSQSIGHLWEVHGKIVYRFPSSWSELDMLIRHALDIPAISLRYNRVVWDWSSLLSFGMHLMLGIYFSFHHLALGLNLESFRCGFEDHAHNMGSVI